MPTPTSATRQSYPSQPTLSRYSTAMGYPAQPSTPPRTPRKAEQPQTCYPKDATAINGGKPKSRSKNRPKNVMTTPAASSQDRITPPLTHAQSAGSVPMSKILGTPTTTDNAPAYAGPTFHASPAPSALPIPSFYSKSVPDSPGITELQKLQGSSTPKETTSPRAVVAEELRERDESPLDFFFRADRAEKARARSATSSQSAVAGPFQPPLATPPMTANSPRRRHGSSSKGSINGIFAMELDGPSSVGQALGPAFSTPYTERIKAAQQSSNHAMYHSSQDAQQSTDRSAALKAYLFSTPSTSPQPTLADIPGRVSNINGFHSINVPPANLAVKGSGRSSGLRKQLTPAVSPQVPSPPRFPSQANGQFQSPRSSTGPKTASPQHAASTSTSSSPFGASNKGSPGLKDMEDNLRRILKLDSIGRA